MLETTSADIPQNESLEIKQDAKFFSRLLSKEKSSVGNPSCRVYYGGVSGSIPFTWESQPGTPKHEFSATSLIPPLTPPPSYYSKSNPKSIKKRPRSGLLHALFRRIMSLNSNEMANAVPSSPSSFSSSVASWSLSSGKYRRRSRFSTPSSSFDSRADDEGMADVESSSASERWFAALGSGSIGKCRGCYCWG
ncbi:hypothetical protein V6N13_080067 [Hibiscus sabdariffa]|uniref:Uncharacterized protein n=1 Tax=Hibiscus sabdariffa TaxID=183260 RepID=A0ABR2RT44_9ROSI